MPAATVTVRELKNKETGLDITVPTHKQTKGLIQSTFEYHVVVVSRLPYFKTAKHKDTDVVQYSISKKFGDFEDLHSKLTAKFPATMLPPLPKKALIVNDNVAKDRRSSLDGFMKLLACTPKISVCSVLLEFLGVNAIKAGKYRKDEELSTESKKSEEEASEQDKSSPEENQSNLFDEEDDENNDELFGEDEEIIENDEPSSTSQATTAEDTKLFGDQDLGGGFGEDEGDDLLFVPGSREESKPSNTSGLSLEEDNSDLLQIEDDLDQFMNITSKPKTKIDTSTSSSSGEIQEVPQKPKPAPRTKPSIPTKPSMAKTPSQDKPEMKPKPAIRKKPSLPQKPGKKPEISLTEDTPPASELDTDDIMKYIQQNTQEEDDVDLFS